VATPAPAAVAAAIATVPPVIVAAAPAPAAAPAAPAACAAVNPNVGAVPLPRVATVTTATIKTVGPYLSSAFKNCPNKLLGAHPPQLASTLGAGTKKTIESIKNKITIFFLRDWFMLLKLQHLIMR
jgi:hypothetical protein